MTGHLVVAVYVGCLVSTFAALWLARVGERRRDAEDRYRRALRREALRRGEWS